MKPTTLLHFVFSPVVISLLWEPRDLWVGIYWNKVDAEHGSKRLDLYLCIVPLLPIRLHYQWTPNNRFKRTVPLRGPAA